MCDYYINTIQSDTECSIFNTSTLMYRPKFELCAGFKIPYPKMKVYIRKLKQPDPGVGGRSKKSYSFKYVIEQKNQVLKF
jgi:hypothetical protein